MAENLNIIYGESTDFGAFFDLIIGQQWDEKREFKKAKRNNRTPNFDPYSSLDNVTRSLAIISVNSEVKSARRAVVEQCLFELRNQLISTSISAIGFMRDSETGRRLERIPNLFWVSANMDLGRNSASDGDEHYEYIRIVSDRYDRAMTASEHIIEAIRHEKKLYEANTGRSWWHVKRKERILNCRAFIKNTFGVNTLKADGYSDKNFDKFVYKFRAGTMV